MIWPIKECPGNDARDACEACDLDVLCQAYIMGDYSKGMTDVLVPKL